MSQTETASFYIHKDHHQDSVFCFSEILRETGMYTSKTDTHDYLIDRFPF